MAIGAADLYQRVGALIASAPNLRAVTDDNRIPVETLRWLAQLSALAAATDGSAREMILNQHQSALIRERGLGSGPDEIMAVAYRMLAKAELAAPPTARGAFVPVGNQFDAFTAVGKILGNAVSTALIVDPYMDETALSEFGGLAGEGVRLALLTDASTAKPGLLPAANRWIGQYAGRRPIHVRFSKPKQLHDRIILIDDDEAWILTQSLKDLAKRSPATIQRVDPELAALKFEAYSAIWDEGATEARTPKDA